jgi:hypothetical protein
MDRFGHRRSLAKNRSNLGFDVHADEGARAWAFRDEIADESGACAQFDVSRTLPPIDENGTLRGTVRVVVRDGDAFESVGELQFVTRLFGVTRFRVGIDEVGIE